MNALRRALRVRPGEGPVALRLFGVMLVAWSAAAVGATGVESLLFARFGPSILPVLFIIVGPVTLTVMLGMGALVARPRPQRTLSLVPLLLAVILVPARLALGLGARWVYPVLWLLMMVVWTVQAMSLWALSGAVHDTRQAKRLFPLYGAGLILGSAVGGLVTRPLASSLHAENLVLVWAGGLALATLLARSAVGDSAPPPRRRGGRRRGPGVWAEMREGIGFVRRWPLLRAMAGALTMFGLLYFAITLPFARAATARFDQPDQLAGFLGAFYGLASAAALVLSLVAANRLFGRFGMAGMILVLPVIYMAGFASLAVVPAFLPLLAFRFLQLSWVNGVWAPGWQALFNVIPEDHRGQARTFMDGGPLQAGTVLAGFLLLAADLLDPRGLYLIGAIAGAVAVAFAWRLRARYRDAVVAALRAGWPEVFVTEEEPFGGFRADGEAMRSLLAAASDPDPRVRRTALEVLAEVPTPEAAEALAQAASAEEPEIRAAALGALARRRIPAALDTLVPSLADGDPVVRARAVEAAAVRDVPEEELTTNIEPLLDDPDPVVRGRAAALLARTGVHPRAWEVLERMLRDPRPSWRVAALEGKTADPVGSATAALSDPDPAVRRAAASSLGRADGRILDPLVRALGDEDGGVRAEAASAVARMGEPAIDRLTGALADPRLQAGALMALRRVSGPPPPGLHSHAEDQAALALRYQALWAALGRDGDDRLGLLRAALRDRVLLHAAQALTALAPFDDPEAVDLALENLGSRDPEQRANALETLDAVGEPEIVRPLLDVWEESERSSGDGAEAVLTLLHEDDGWLRACAAFAAGALDDPRVRAALEELAGSDADTLVRETAARSLKGDVAVETLPTLSVMDRILALRKVPLFRQLSPVDLKHVADSATEHVYLDGSRIAEQGDPGDAMHVVVTGDVAVLLGQAPDRAVEVARRGPGYIVGEMAILSEEPRMASLVASGEVRTLSIDRKRFQRIVRERPEVSLGVMRELCFRLREAHGRDQASPS